jgi:hypothetical protein
VNKLAVWLLWLFALHAGCHVMLADDLRDRTMTSPPLVDGVSITVETMPTGLLALGTFERRVILRRAGHRLASHWIGDTLNANRDIEVYQTGPHEMVLALRLRAYDVDLAKGVIRLQAAQWPCDMKRPPDSTFLGIFVEPRYQFLPASSVQGGGRLQGVEVETSESCKGRLERWLHWRGQNAPRQ